MPVIKKLLKTKLFYGYLFAFFVLAFLISHTSGYFGHLQRMWLLEQLYDDVTNAIIIEGGQQALQGGYK
jgi:hypothetical protein